jgi:uncharacterized membrane protein
MQSGSRGKPYKSYRSEQITQDQSYYEGNLKSKEPTMMTQFARMNSPKLKPFLVLASKQVNEIQCNELVVDKIIRAKYHHALTFLTVWEGNTI